MHSSRLSISSYDSDDSTLAVYDDLESDWAVIGSPIAENKTTLTAHALCDPSLGATVTSLGSISSEEPARDVLSSVVSLPSGLFKHDEKSIIPEVKTKKPRPYYRGRPSWCALRFRAPRSIELNAPLSITELSVLLSGHEPGEEDEWAIFSTPLNIHGRSNVSFINVQCNVKVLELVVLMKSQGREASGTWDTVVESVRYDDSGECWRNLQHVKNTVKKICWQKFEIWLQEMDSPVNDYDKLLSYAKERFKSPVNYCETIGQWLGIS